MPECPYTYLEPEEVEQAQQTQQLINGGVAWRLEGSYGRSMMQMIRGGYCLLGREYSRDAYGNHIPSRDEVEAGTKGSYEYVAKLHGTEWADYMAALTEKSLV
jgi:hypothetical protein